MYAAGCYAENRGQMGRPSPFMQAGKGMIEGTDYTPLIAAIRRVGAGQMIRLNVAGDYLLEDGEPDMAYIEATNEAHRLTVLSYTHAWERLDPAWFTDTTRPNASCDTPADVAEAISRGWAAVIVDPDQRYPQGSKIAGATAVTCPYETSGRQCIDCGLCARTKRPSVVVFDVHGAKRKLAAASLQEVAA
jgi:hypothetical protein